MTLSDKKRNLYKAMLTEVAQQTNLHGAVAEELLSDIDTLFDGYNQSQKVVPFDAKRKIFDLLTKWDRLSAYEQNFVIGVSNYYASGTQTSRQESYLNKIWREAEKRNAEVLLDYGYHFQPVDISDGPV